MDPKKWPAHVSVSHWIFKKNSTRSEDAHVSATADVHQVDGYSSSCFGGSNIAGYSTDGISTDCPVVASNVASNVEPHQSSPYGVVLVPTGVNTDMDDRIIIDSLYQ